MPTRRLAGIAIAALALTHAGAAWADDGCSAGASASGDTASRIAAIACTEHALWYAPFIDEHGRLASMRVAEAESVRLHDGNTPAWRRVAMYWQSSGVQWPSQSLASASDCLSGDRVSTALCRVFLIETPWSAVFVSYIMRAAGVPGFQPSARHVDYVRDALRDDAAEPYRLADPDVEPPAVGDLVCFSRSSQVFGVQAFRNWLARSSSAPLAMHCDVVVSASAGHARLVGGNVLQGVTMRMLPLDSRGRFWSLPRRLMDEMQCTPATPNACNLNRQDWVALLKLKPSANTRPAALPATGGPCCTVCTLPMPAGMRRCPVLRTEPPADVPPPRPSPD